MSRCRSAATAIAVLCAGERPTPCAASLGKVAALAGACDLDPAFLLRLYLAEHHPPVWEVVQRMLDNALTRNEQTLLALYRKAAPLNEIEITPERETAILEVLGADGDTPGKGKKGAGKARDKRRG